MLRSHRGWLVAFVSLASFIGCGGDDGSASSSTATDTDPGTTSMTGPGTSMSGGTSTSSTATTEPPGTSAPTTSSSGPDPSSSSASVTQTDSQTTDPGTDTDTDTDTDTESSTTTGEEATTVLLAIDAGVVPPALFALNTVTGLGQAVCGLGPSFVIDTMEFTDSNELLVHDTSTNRILRVDPCDCGFQVVGLSDVDDLEFTRDDEGNMRGVVPVLSAYVTVNELTGAASIQGALGLEFLDGAVTWSEAESQLLLLEATTNQLFRFDPVTLALGNPTTVVPDIVDPGLTTVAQTGEAYMCADTTFYELNIMTGTATSIGLTGMVGPCTVLAAPRFALGCL